MENVSGVIPAAEVVPGVTIAVRSVSNLRATEAARSSSSSGTQAGKAAIEVIPRCLWPCEPDHAQHEPRRKFAAQ